MSLSLLRLASAIGLSLIVIPTAARADGEPLPARTVGVDGAVVLPLGNYGDAASLAFGPIARLEFPVAHRLAITARAGELGITIAYARADTGFGTASDSTSKLGGSFGAGLRRGALDFRAALFIPDFDHVDDPGIMGSVGFDFATL